MSDVRDGRVLVCSINAKDIRELRHEKLTVGAQFSIDCPLPTHAMFSVHSPCTRLEGHLQSMMHPIGRFHCAKFSAEVHTSVIAGRSRMPSRSTVCRIVKGTRVTLCF